MKDKNGFTIKCIHSDWKVIDMRDNKDYVCQKFPTLNFKAHECYADEYCRFYKPELRTEGEQDD